MKFDLKSIVVGLLLGVIIVLIVGATGGGSACGIGFAVPTGSTAIVKASNGEAFVIDMNTLMAKRILFKKPEPGDTRYPNNVNGRALILAD
jgi:hypothetical protein